MKAMNSGTRKLIKQNAIGKLLYIRIMGSCACMYLSNLLWGIEYGISLVN